MRRIGAIAGLTIRGAVRSRAVPVLVCALALVVIGLPLTVTGDGTVEGHVQVLLGFSLGAVGGLLGLAAVGAGCGAMALDIRDRKIHLLSTKPVRPLEIWLGRALGLAAVQGLLLAASGAGVYGMLRWTLRAERWGASVQNGRPGGLLASRACAVPVAPGARELANEIYEREIRTDPQLARAERAVALEAILRTVESRAFSMAPGTERVWPVRLACRPDGDRPLVLQFRFAKSTPDVEPVSGIWRVRVPGMDWAFEQAGEWRPQVLYRIEIPEAIAGGGRDLEIGWIHRGEASLVFDSRRGIEVQVPRGVFETNLFRALALIYARLLLLTAIGLAAGTMFSLPVAALCSACLILLLHLGDTLDAMATQPRYFGDSSGSTLTEIADRGLRAMYRTLDAGVRPLRGTDAIEALGNGRRISWSETARAAGVQVGLYGGFLALLSAASLSRRELGAAT
jgi:hypothetical protein